MHIQTCDETNTHERTYDTINRHECVCDRECVCVCVWSCVYIYAYAYMCVCGVTSNVCNRHTIDMLHVYHVRICRYIIHTYIH